MSNQHEVVITAMVRKRGKYLIMRRSANKKRFPLRWTVPGGHLEVEDYTSRKKDTTEYWYNVLERALEREVFEEAGIKIKNVRYVTSLATIHSNGTPSLVISCLADYKSGKIRLQEEECDSFKWVDLEQAKKFDLVDGIYDELAMADAVAKGRKLEWRRARK